MAKAPASEQIMPAAKLKPLLTLSKREPVQAAIALTSDGDALILLDKRAKPKKVAAMLRGEASKAKLTLNAATLRYGRAEVDPEYDSAMVRFFLNKDAPASMRPKLVEVVKPIAFGKVELNVDPSIEEDSEEEAQATEAAAPPPSVAAAPPPGGPAAPSADALRQALVALSKRIPEAAGADANRRTSLLQIAGQANEQLKAGDATAAAATMARLRDAMAPAGPGGGTSTRRPDAPGIAFRKALLRWRDAQSELNSNLQTIGTTLLGRPEIKADPRLPEIERAVAGLPKLVPEFGGQLEEVLDKGLNAAEPAEQARLKQEGITAISAYRARLASAAPLLELERFAAGPLGAGVKLNAALDAALAELEQHLAA